MENGYQLLWTSPFGMGVKVFSCPEMCLETHFSQIVYMDLTACKMEEIEKMNLQKFTKLEEISLPMSILEFPSHMKQEGCVFQRVSFQKFQKDQMENHLETVNSGNSKWHIKTLTHNCIQLHGLELVNYSPLEIEKILIYINHHFNGKRIACIFINIIDPPRIVRKIFQMNQNITKVSFFWDSPEERIAD
ncbi:MAG: hypothetical protein Q4C96_04185 [Planctomycetia bacterium]|nr:hypothetical protein [Planctomycetia bacterium]